jgi:hypothetical protein
MTISQQIENARNEAAQHKAIWMANKDKADRKASKLAKDAAEQLEFWTNKMAMLNAMSKNSQFHGK